MSRKFTLVSLNMGIQQGYGKEKGPHFHMIETGS